VTYPTILPRSSRVLEEVSHERARQDAKWGEQNHPNGTRDDRRLLRDTSLPTWGALCYRARSLTDKAAQAGTLEYLDILVEEVAEALSESDPQRLRAELIQVAAVAVAWVEAIDRRASKDGAASEYRVTFGCKYAREPHPSFPDAHPDGWVTIVAPDEMAARRVAHERLSGQYAFIYAPEEWEPEWFPRGELARWTS
jgi:hypothetical protein